MDSSTPKAQTRREQHRKARKAASTELVRSTPRPSKATGGLGDAGRSPETNDFRTRRSFLL